MGWTFSPSVDVAGVREWGVCDMCDGTGRDWMDEEGERACGWCEGVGQRENFSVLHAWDCSMVNGPDFIRYLDLPVDWEECYGEIPAGEIGRYRERVEGMLAGYDAHGVAFGKETRWVASNWVACGRDSGRLRRYLEAMLAGLRFCEERGCRYVYHG